MSGNWQFSSCEGNLQWNGVDLFSKLSPTLILGHQEEGDTLPVDYIKLSAVRSATMKTDTAIELIVDGAPTMVLKAPSVAEAKTWMNNITAAISSDKPKAPTPAAASAPAAQAAPAAAPYAASAAIAPASGTFIPQPLAPVSQPRRADPVVRSFPTGDPSVVRPTSNASTPNFNPGQQQQQQGQDDVNTCAFDTSGSHEFRPLHEVTGNRVQTTTITSHNDTQKPLPASFRPVDLRIGGAGIQQPPAPWVPATQGLSPAPSQNVAPGKSSNPLHTTTSISPIAGSSNRIGASSIAGFNSRPLPGALNDSENINSSLSGSHTPSGLQQQHLQHAGSLHTYDDYTPSVSASLRKRSGMLVDVPPNPQANRNVAPNVSAIWKEWIGPDGVLYVSHETTGTIQRRIGDTEDFETLQDGNDDVPEEDLRLRPHYTGMETAVDLNTQTIRNLNRYGGGNGSNVGSVSSPMIYRQDTVTTPRGQYSPTRRTNLSSLVPPRQSQTSYSGRRVHQLVLGPGGADATTVVEHQIQLLGATGLKWDPATGVATAPDGSASRGVIGPSTLEKQWEHVRRILLQGRYFKKHALRTSGSSCRFIFLTADNAYVVCVPTSEVPFNVSNDPMTFGSVTDTVQYYGPQSRAIALNTITHVSLGSDEEFVRQRRSLKADSVFCIISKTHAFILECNTPEEAKYFADAWTFFLYHSKPINPQKNKTAQVRNPITHGTRTGFAF